MINLKLNPNAINEWFRDRGDYTHNINYDLDQNSTIIDLGGYTGVWAQQMIEKYNPNVYIVEPVTEFFNVLSDKFSNNNKVHLLNIGVSDEERDDIIYLNNDATSSNIKDGRSVEVKFIKIEKLLEVWNLEKVDLIQINIEGDEYSLLEDMLKTGSINKFLNIQVQFHMGIENDVDRRNKIREGLIINGFKNKFDYPFVWESWYKE